jgi:hypothetical protein
VGGALGVVAAVVLGLAAGAMLAEAALLVPWWRSLAPEAFFAWYAANAARLFAFFGPLEGGGAVAAIAAAAAGRRAGGSRWRGAAAVLAVLVLAFFPLYFQDVNARFETAAMPPDALPAELARWAAWHGGRTAIGIGAFAAAVLGVRAAR